MPIQLVDDVRVSFCPDQRRDGVVPEGVEVHPLYPDGLPVAGKPFAENKAVLLCDTTGRQLGPEHRVALAPPFGDVLAKPKLQGDAMQGHLADGRKRLELPAGRFPFAAAVVGVDVRIAMTQIFLEPGDMCCRNWSDSPDA